MIDVHVIPSPREHLLDLLNDYHHLPPQLQRVSGEIADTANYVANLLQDGPELTAGLRKLLEAQDCLVRQAVIDARGD